MAHEEARIASLGCEPRRKRVVGIIIVEFAHPIGKRLVEQTAQSSSQKDISAVRKKIYADGRQRVIGS